MDEDGGPLRYCPRCGCEYRAGFEICTDCGVDLVDAPPAAPAGPKGDFDPTMIVGPNAVAVFSTGSEVGAAVVRGLLVDADIPAAVWSSGFGGYLGHASSVGTFAHRVMVHPDDETEARELIASMPEAEPEPGR